MVQLTGTCSGSESSILSCERTPTALLRGRERVIGFTEVAVDSQRCRSGLDEVALQCGKLKAKSILYIVTVQLLHSSLISILSESILNMFYLSET